MKLRLDKSTTIQSVATGNQPATTSEPQKLSEAPVSRSVSTVSASLSRNRLSDMNLLLYANISGGTFTFNVINQE